jgi:hypothetical protein
MSGSHEEADLLYCHWYITEQRHWKELWVIGFFPLVEANNLPPLSQQAEDSQTKQIGTQTYIDYVPILPYFVMVCVWPLLSQK